MKWQIYVICGAVMSSVSAFAMESSNNFLKNNRHFADVQNRKNKAICEKNRNWLDNNNNNMCMELLGFLSGSPGEYTNLLGEAQGTESAAEIYATDSEKYGDLLVEIQEILFNTDNESIATVYGRLLMILEKEPSLFADFVNNTQYVINTLLKNDPRSIPHILFDKLENVKAIEFVIKKMPLDELNHHLCYQLLRHSLLVNPKIFEIFIRETDILKNISRSNNQELQKTIKNSADNIREKGADPEARYEIVKEKENPFQSSVEQAMLHESKRKNPNDELSRQLANLSLEQEDSLETVNQRRMITGKRKMIGH